VTREHDVVLFGATGFTGALTAAYLAAHAGAGWALAGRSRAKLEALRDELGVDVPILVADSTDPTSLRRVAESARVVATTVGPYALRGEPLVAACAAAGTDYVDLCGEPEFVDRTYVRHHALAERTGARLVHACGFDSVPHDLGAQFTVEQLPADRPISMRGYVQAGGTVSGGTLASAVTAFSRTRQTSAAARTRQATEAMAAKTMDAKTMDAKTMATEPPTDGRRARAVGGRPGYDRVIGRWIVPLPTIDPQIVVRSARALPRYGPDFRYSHVVALSSPFAVVGLLAGAGGAFLLAQLPPTRSLLLRARPAGTGPGAEQRAKSWFRIRFHAVAGDQQVTTEVAGGDPGYGETSKMLAESALCLARDELPATAGQVTTAVAMGASLRTRLIDAGLSFTVLEPSRR
jgi:short subunit dehydrogenase-like uncharacterized protein